MITRARPASRPYDPNSDEILSNQPRVSEKLIIQKQNFNTDFQPRTQATSVISNPNINNIETTECKNPTEITEQSPPTRSALIPSNNIALYVRTKKNPQKSRSTEGPKKSAMFLSKAETFDATNHQLHFQNTAMLSFLQFHRTQREFPM